MPDDLRQYLKKAARIETLRGKSGARVYRAHFPNDSVIVKESAKEARFYRNIAPVLRANAIPLPETVAIFGDSWVVLEDIPLPANADDARMVAILARLHTIVAEIQIEDAYMPTWTEELTEKALACFSDDLARQFRPVFADLRHQAQALFQPEVYISGDPNLANWGARQVGTLILFDWERFTRGTPAIDLAITVAGLGNQEQFSKTAQVYLDERRKLGCDYEISAENLAESMVLAKLLIVIEFLSNYTDGRLQPDATLDYIRRELPAWMKAL